MGNDSMPRCLICKGVMKLFKQNDVYVPSIGMLKRKAYICPTCDKAPELLIYEDKEQGFVLLTRETNYFKEVKHHD